MQKGSDDPRNADEHFSSTKCQKSRRVQETCGNCVEEGRELEN